MVAMVIDEVSGKAKCVLLFLEVKSLFFVECLKN
jgi:hypothetical protein